MWKFLIRAPINIEYLWEVMINFPSKLHNHYNRQVDDYKKVDKCLL